MRLLRVIAMFSGMEMIKTVKSKLLLALFSVAAAASFTASTELPSLQERTAVPFGYYDTEASGARRAEQDLARGVVKYAVYGLPSKPFVDKLVSAGVTPLFMGCLVGGEGTSFWTGYNDYMESRLPGRMLKTRLTKVSGEI
jgi:hypothetical protein